MIDSPLCPDGSSHRILVVEDDAELRALLRDYLSSNGFCVSTYDTGEGAPERILEDNPSVVVLDLMLPGIDGIEICRRIRNTFTGGITMLTARRADLDQLMGLEAGADDYVVKPVDPRILLARLRSLIRRLTPGGGQRLHPRDLTLGPLRILPRKQEVWIGDNPVAMTRAEFGVLLRLARHVGEVVSRNDLCEQVRGVAYDGIDRSIDIHVSRIRRKLTNSGGDSQWIRAIRGVGYVLVELE